MLTERFMLRPLTAADASERYLGWLADPASGRYIQAARATRTLDDLRNYIAARADRPDVLFLGIFDRTAGSHIGNIKYEPIDAASGSAELGILIGEASWRGRGVAREVVAATSRWLRLNRGVARICLGVEKENQAALSAYLSAGFRPTGTARHPNVKGEIVRMALEVEG